MKAVLAAGLAVFVATSLFAGSSTGQEAESASPEPLFQWRCKAIPVFTPYCEAIKVAVEGHEPEVDARATATSHEAGTRVGLDFGGAAVTGDEMASLLLAADSLLPGHIGAIELRNLLLQGKLELKSTDFRRALTLDEVRFTDADGQCADDDDHGAPGERQPRGGLGIDGSRFHKQVRLSRVHGCGDLQILSSRFDRGLLFDSESASKSNLRGKLIINQSRIDRELFMNNWFISSMRLALSNFDAVHLRRTRVTDSFEFRDSVVFSLSAYQIVLPSQASLRGNHVRDSVNLSELYIADAPSSGRMRNNPHRYAALLLEDQKPLHFADNEVEGRLVIGIRGEPAIPPIILAAVEPVALRLHHNRVEGSADVFIEEGLPSEIDLRGSKFASELLLTRACMAQQGQEKAALGSCRQRCGLRINEYGFCAVDPDLRTSREDATRLDVKLAAVEVDSLVWNLRGDGVSWSGPGLRYTYWDPEPRHGQRPYETRAVGGGAGGRPNSMQAWLARLERTPHAVDPLTYGAAYLKEHGLVAEAAGTRLQALRSNLWNKVKTESAEALPPGFAFIGSVIFFIALAPVGWGARPEWALLGMTILVLLFWWLYAWHSRQSKKANWPEENLHSWDVQISRVHLQDAVTEVVAAIANGGDRKRTAAIESHAGPLALSHIAERTEDNKAFHASLNISPKDPPAFSLIPGFNQYNNTFPPRQFSLFLFSLDAMLPVISLHHFDRYYPTNIDENFEQTPYQWVRWLSIGQHGIGWWLSTVFVASLFV
jgi:hypothetical protein